MSDIKCKAMVIFGPPGSGKGTVGVKLAQTTKVKHISSGDVFRGLVPSSESGKLFSQYANQGQLVPDQATVDIFIRYLEGLVKTNKFNPEEDLLLLDGIPRTVNQVELLSSYIEFKQVFVLEIANHQVVIDRILGRAEVEGRADDKSEDLIRQRLEEYERKTAAVLPLFDQEQILRINGDAHPDRVFADAINAFVESSKR
ncbi:MAG: nucleoside monophosphate kinase [Fibrobacter sp.]|nr:nucleoside monophosphate kinase [Fibrobacter sp.]